MTDNNRTPPEQMPVAFFPCRREDERRKPDNRRKQIIGIDDLWTLRVLSRDMSQGDSVSWKSNHGQSVSFASEGEMRDHATTVAKNRRDLEFSFQSNHQSERREGVENRKDGSERRQNNTADEFGFVRGIAKYGKKPPHYTTDPSPAMKPPDTDE
ncbi:MAG: hypothetical protein ACR2PR_09220 [Pseudohongiellaceae bacterium]